MSAVCSGIMLNIKKCILDTVFVNSLDLLSDGTLWLKHWLTQDSTQMKIKYVLVEISNEIFRWDILNLYIGDLPNLHAIFSWHFGEIFLVHNLWLIQ